MTTGRVNQPYFPNEAEDQRTANVCHLQTDPFILPLAGFYRACKMRKTRGQKCQRGNTMVKPEIYFCRTHCGLKDGNFERVSVLSNLFGNYCRHLLGLVHRTGMFYFNGGPITLTSSHIVLRKNNTLDK